MSHLPTLEMRSFARAIYMRRLGDSRPWQSTQELIEEGCFCLSVILQISNHVERSFGLAPFLSPPAGSRNETLCALVDRWAAAVECIGHVEEGEEGRPNNHVRERRLRTRARSAQ